MNVSKHLATDHRDLRQQLLMDFAVLVCFAANLTIPTPAALLLREAIHFI